MIIYLYKPIEAFNLTKKEFGNITKFLTLKVLFKSFLSITPLNMTLKLCLTLS